MAVPRANTEPAAVSDNPRRYIISLEQTRYLATPTALRRLLEVKFNRPFDPNTISERNYRLIYHAERELEEAEIEEWIDRLDDERKAMNAARRAQATTEATAATAAREALPIES